MKSFSSVLSWLLLAAALAVPSFLFYNWWSKGKQRASAEIGQPPVTSSVFPAQAGSHSPAAPKAQPVAETGGPSGAQPLRADQPPSASAAAPAASPPGGGPMDEEAAEEEADQASAQGLPLTPGPAQPGQPAAQEKDAAQSSTETKKFSYYSPKTDRDPTLSPEDYARIREVRRQQEEAERRRARDAQRAEKQSGPETLLSLQGIVGQSAIINGEMYGVGQRVRGARILKIGADYVNFEYKGKKFRKLIQ